MIPTQAVAPSQEEILKQIPTRAHITNRMVAAFKVSIIMMKQHEKDENPKNIK